MSAIETAPSVRTHYAALRLEPMTRSAGGALRVKGTAVVYNSPTPAGNLPWRETILPGAFREALAEADLLLLVGHDRNRPLARQSAGNLRVRDTASGLEFEADLVDTTDGRDTWALLSAGVVKGCSFAFVPDPFGERWFSKDGEEWCEISRVKELRELTLTADPCYPQTSAEARSSQALEAIRHKLRVQERSAYGPDSEYSWFRDLVTVREAARLTERLERQGVRRHVPGHLIEQGIPDRVHGGLEQARKRLASVQQRDVGTGALTGMADTATLVPEFIAATFQTASRAAGTLTAALPREELPPGFVVPAGYVANVTVTTPAGAGVQASENTAVASQDPAGTTTTLKPATIAGRFTISRQLLDRGTSVDVLLARELGAAAGATLETQVVNGSGASGQLLGLLNTAAAISVSYTDASPSAAELWTVLLQARSKIATQAGELPTLLAGHPRRYSWLLAALDASNAWARLDPPLQVVETLGMPTTLGGGSNEDALLALSPRGAMLLDRPTQFILDEESPTGKLAVQLAAWHLACLVTPEPKGVAVIGGTGLAAPSGF